MALGTTNISMSAVRTLLGESSWTLSGLCTSANINKWSKYKPVRGTWPAGEWPYTYGVLVDSSWAYVQPNNNYRLGDFRNYDHDALPPIKLVDYPDASQLNKENLNFAIEINNDSSTALNLTDLGLNWVNPEGYYFCIKVGGVGGTYYPADHPLGEAYGDLISVPKSTSGTYEWEALITTSYTGGPGPLLPDDVAGYINSGVCVLTLEPPIVYTIDNVPDLSAPTSYETLCYISGGNILMDKTGSFVGTVYFWVEGSIVGSYNFDNAAPEFGVNTGVSAPTGWGSSKTITIED